MEFPTGYFKAECREGFEISMMMKRAWAAQIEVLPVVAEICERHKLQYYADWGTLLGAIRHKGFIPWDDDIDICLKRKEYNELIRILPKELPYGFVVSGMYAESERLQNATFDDQLRVIADEERWDFSDYMRRFHGFPYQRIGIDIFPLDNRIEEGTAQIQRELVWYGIVILRDWDKLEEAGDLQGHLKEFGELCSVDISPRKDLKNWMWRLVDGICSLYEGEQTDELTNFPAWIVLPQYCVKKEWYEKAVYVPFENIEIPVPGEYDKVLRAQYGDYMIPQKGTALHNYPFYGNLEKKFEKQVREWGFKGSIDEFCDKMSRGEKIIFDFWG